MMRFVPMSHDRSSTEALSRRLLLGAGLLSSALGAMTLIGWMAHRPVLTRISPDWAPVHWNSALCLVMLGLAAPLLAHGRHRVVKVLGSFIAAFGIATLIEYVTGVSLGIDQLFAADYLSTGAAYPGRMSVLSATCYSALGCGLLFATLDRLRVWHLGVTGLTAWPRSGWSGLLSLLGYASGVEAAYSWGSLTRMGLPTAIATFGVSGALVGVVLESCRRVQFDFSRWLPVTASVTLMAMVACVSAVSLVKLKTSIYWRTHTYEVLGSSQAMVADLADSLRACTGMC